MFKSLAVFAILGMIGIGAFWFMRPTSNHEWLNDRLKSLKNIQEVVAQARRWNALISKDAAAVKSSVEAQAGVLRTCAAHLRAWQLAERWRDEGKPDDVLADDYRTIINPALQAAIRELDETKSICN